MIDNHVHGREIGDSSLTDETIGHMLYVAYRAGYCAVMDQPNKKNPVTTWELAKECLDAAKEAKKQYGIEIFYGIHLGVTADRRQLRDAVKCCREQAPWVVGLKAFMYDFNDAEQKLIFQILADERYAGVLMLHCEDKSLFRPELWDPSKPISHSYARPEEAEVASVEKSISNALDAGYKGKLHFTHLSVPKSVGLVQEAKKAGLTASCGVTPQHCKLYTEMLEGMPPGETLLGKVNPPLRCKTSADGMFARLKKREIDIIGSDHAPHEKNRKVGPPYMSGFPVLPFMPHFVEHLKREGFDESHIHALTHGNVCMIYGLQLSNTLEPRKPDMSLHTEYEVDVFEGLRNEWGFGKEAPAKKVKQK